MARFFHYLRCLTPNTMHAVSVAQVTAYLRCRTSESLALLLLFLRFKQFPNQAMYIGEHKEMDITRRWLADHRLHRKCSCYDASRR